jgi:hypothetical protein
MTAVQLQLAEMAQREQERLTIAAVERARAEQMSPMPLLLHRCFSRQ